jgi:dihydropyrimidinase
VSEGRLLMRADLAVRGGRVVSDGAITEATLLVTGGRVTAWVDPATPVDAARIVEAGGASVLPGAVDPHVHFAVFSPMVDDFESASVSAAYGGVTTIIPFIGPGEDMGVGEALDLFIEEGRRRSVVDFAMHCRLRPDPKLIDRIPEAVERGVPSVKFFLAYRKRGMLFGDDLALRVLEVTAACGGLALVHAENGLAIDHLEERLAAAGRTAPTDYLASRPHATESEAVARAIALAELAGCPLYVVHLSTREGLDEIRRARDRGAPVFAETCPQYLLLTDAEMARQKGRAKVAPPLRWNRDREALWSGLRDGSVQTIGSDHAPYTAADKAVGEHDIFAAAFGMPGLETMVPLVLGGPGERGGLDLAGLVRRLSENAARIFGLYPRKGTLRVGADADFVLWDPEVETTIEARHLHSRAGYTCFEGWPVRGRIRAVYQRGRPLVEDGRLRARPGDGRFLPRRPGRPEPATW